MLRSRSTKFIHKFSIACPAHLVATVMCITFAIIFAINTSVLGLMFSKLGEMDRRIDTIVGGVHGTVINTTLLDNNTSDWW